MKTLILTVGLPRSGKSTWAKNEKVPIVNPDAIRLALHGQAFIGEAEPMVWTIAKYMVKALFLAGHVKVILDATNVTKARRDEWLSRDWGCKYKVFEVSEEECLRRAEATDQKYLCDIIMRMALQAEPLTEEEKLCEVF